MILPSLLTIRWWIPAPDRSELDLSSTDVRIDKLLILSHLDLMGQIKAKQRRVYNPKPTDSFVSSFPFLSLSARCSIQWPLFLSSPCSRCFCSPVRWCLSCHRFWRCRRRCLLIMKMKEKFDFLWLFEVRLEFDSDSTRFFSLCVHDRLFSVVENWRKFWTNFID